MWEELDKLGFGKLGFGRTIALDIWEDGCFGHGSQRLLFGVHDIRVPFIGRVKGYIPWKEDESRGGNTCLSVCPKTIPVPCLLYIPLGKLKVKIRTALGPPS